MVADPSKYFNYNRSNSDFAKQMRREPTYGEKIMRNMLRKDSTGYRFLRQKNFGPYILDFYCSKLKLCIEVD
jgi:very-short-patch-repair endonuclease